MKIGSREVVHTVSLIIPSGEDAWVSFNVGSWCVKVNVLFRSSSEEGEKGGITIEGLDDYAKVTLINWSNSLGTATIKPVELGKTNEGHRLTFMATHWLVGNVNRLDLQFLLGGDE